MVRKPDVLPLAHLGKVEGDVSSHCMCAECRASFEAFTCPFCRGKIGGSFVATPAIKKFVDGFVKLVARESLKGDQHAHARWLESWEAFEFEHGNFLSSDGGVNHTEGRPDVVANVAALLVQDRRFSALLEQGIAAAKMSSDGNTWLANGAGIVFRLHGLLQSGSLAIAPSLAALLRAAYDAVFAALEKPGSGAFLGCFYMQALSAYLSACRCGDGETAADAEMVRRAGTIVARQCAKDADKVAEVRSHVVEEYVRIATEQVWGGVGKDPVLKAAFA